MKIKTRNPALRRFYNEAIMGDHYDPPGITFNDEGIARVKREVGEALVESDEFPDMVLPDASDASGGADESSDEDTTDADDGDE